MPRTDEHEPGAFERVATTLSKHLITKLLLLLAVVGSVAWLGGKFLGNDPDKELREEFARLNTEVIPALDSAVAVAVASENLAWDSVGVSNERVKVLATALTDAASPTVIYRTVTVTEPGEPPVTETLAAVVIHDTLTGAVDTIEVHPKVAKAVNDCRILAAECALLSVRLDTALVRKAVTDSINEVLRDSLDAAIDVATEIIEPSRVPFFGIPWKALVPVTTVTFSATYNILKCEESTSTMVSFDNDFPSTNTVTEKCPSRLAVGPSVGLGWIIHF